ncbi:thioesterase superfamily protein [Ruminiclostridium papyrosolvens DSM 2782]|uniref:Thioesterase superfamily protein n=1 Tax=Ruminiclostridium papyrosolvens DSM 2782 TaxID=588581 RepID=F1TCN7_9FIRM|nr:thioesterase family protein [Ruminiclostridium papyrosolvens]EGD47754.1 thioesterase superfamily protein [Ruminiclostridium papyrosolvens DSM 2782]WES34471.1 thioesterase family protein [Ruminiclostridium papyrosolvens DSM 2782]
MDLKVGITGSTEVLVSEANTAKTMGSGSLDVFATPAMIALMEKAASMTVQNYIDEDSSTVGTMINIKHIAATPIGMNVTAKAELVEIEGKRLVFSVEAFDGKDKIGEGQHERFIIKAEKFIAKANSKLNE